VPDTKRMACKKFISTQDIYISFPPPGAGGGGSSI